jgi:hypothetical protein
MDDPPRRPPRPAGLLFQMAVVGGLGHCGTCFGTVLVGSKP